MTRPAGQTAVMARKRPRLSDAQPWQDFELFPTPPWATRTLFETVFPAMGIERPVNVWEPCAGLGHMSEVIGEYVDCVDATDIHDYGENFVCGSGDFLTWPLDKATGVDWIVTNPPFGKAAAMAERALSTARVGVAFLLRLQFLETDGRYDFFWRRPPVMASFTERVPMCEGGYDPRCKSATAYAWFVWERDCSWRRPGAKNAWIRTLLIPPGRKKALFRPDIDLKLAARCVPGFVPPSTLKKAGAAQLRLENA